MAMAERYSLLGDVAPSSQLRPGDRRWLHCARTLSVKLAVPMAIVLMAVLPRSSAACSCLEIPASAKAEMSRQDAVFTAR